MKGTAKLPVNVQVVTLPNQDELCLNLMKQIDERVKFYATHKLPMWGNRGTFETKVVLV